MRRWFFPAALALALLPSLVHASDGQWDAAPTETASKPSLEPIVSGAVKQQIDDELVLPPKRDSFRRRTPRDRRESARDWRNLSMGLTIATGGAGLLLFVGDALSKMCIDVFGNGCGHRSTLGPVGYAGAGMMLGALFIGLPTTVILHKRLERHRRELVQHRLVSVAPAVLPGPNGQVPGIQVAGRW